jgi:hypothetical protein
MTQKSLLAGRIPKGHPMAEAEARYAFLHEGVLRSYLFRGEPRKRNLPTLRATVQWLDPLNAKPVKLALRFMLEDLGLRARF